jgi:hypothetical protein
MVELLEERTGLVLPGYVFKKHEHVLLPSPLPMVGMQM